MPISSTRTVIETSATVEARLCAGLKPKPAPLSVREAMDTLPKPGDDEPAEAYRSRLSPEQRAILDAYNKEATDGALWTETCKHKEA